jgi:ubiquinone/menaquinone biosynthesis C-methylase UbiE
LSTPKIAEYVIPPYRKQRTFYHSQKQFIHAREAFYKEIRQHHPESILDVGCGTGLDSHFIMSQNIKYVGVDPIKENLELARRDNPQGDFRVGFMQELPFKDNSFDWVWTCTVWELLPPKYMKLGIEECIRVARKRVYNLDATRHPIKMTERYLAVPMNLHLKIERVHYDPEKKKANYLWTIDLEKKI